MNLRDATLYRERILAADQAAEPLEEGARWVVSWDNYRNRSGHAPEDGSSVPGWAIDPDPEDPDAPTLELLRAFVERGAWMVQCHCLSAALACRTDHRFYCVTCGNVEVDGAWIEVQWPDDADAIEELLVKRMYSANRNWRPGESLEQLADENAANPRKVRG